MRLLDRLSIEDRYSKTKAKKVGVIAKTLKYKYAGHLARDSDYKWNKILTTWVPYKGKRSRERPRTRWIDKTKDNLGGSWMRRAKNIAEWKDLVSTYTQKWATEGVDSVS